jgi:hypothetical protein
MTDTNYVQQYENLLANPGTVDPAQLTGGTAQQGMQNFFNTPQYQLLFGNNGGNPISTDPTQRFQQDPGYAFNLNQALNAVNAKSAAGGLLESGTGEQNLLSTAQGMQNQEYQTWLGQQNGLFTGYQNQLSALAQFGAGQTQSQNQVSTGDLLAQLLLGANLSTGQGVSNANLGTGSNISSLLGNQGTLNAGAYLNTAGAQVGALLSAAGLGAQMSNSSAQNYNQAQSNQNNTNALKSFLGNGNQASGGGYY